MKKTIEQKPKTERKVIVKKKNIYEVVDSLFFKLFDKEPNHISFDTSIKKPKSLDFFRKDGIVKITGILSPEFIGKYHTVNDDNYTLFIFEYTNDSLAKKSFSKLKKDNESIIELIKNDEWGNSDGNKKNPEKDRIMTFSVYCKSGGFIFRKNNFLISLMESCSTPLTKEKTTWKEYEDIFLNAFKVYKDKKFLNANCGSRNYYYEN